MTHAQTCGPMWRVRRLDHGSVICPGRPSLHPSATPPSPACCCTVQICESAGFGMAPTVALVGGRSNCKRKGRNCTNLNVNLVEWPFGMFMKVVN